MNQTGVRCHMTQNRGLESSDVQGTSAQPLGAAQPRAGPKNSRPSRRAGSRAPAPHSSRMPRSSNNHVAPGDSSSHQPLSQKCQDANDSRDQENEPVPEPGKMPAEPPAGCGAATSCHYTKDTLMLFL